MLNISAVNEVVVRAVSAALRGVEISRIDSQPAVDSDGHDALHVTIVLARSNKKELSGDDALDTIVRVLRDLQKSGEDRFPIIDFATEDELVSNGDLEP